MALSNPAKITLYSIAVVAVLGMIGSLIIGNIVSKKVEEFLEEQSFSGHHLSVDKVSINLFDRSLTIRNFTFRPSDSAMLSLKVDPSNKSPLNVISASRIKIKGVQILPALTQENIIINRLIIDDLLIQRFETGKKSSAKNKEKGERFQLDSIKIEGISGFELRSIQLRNLKGQLIDARTNDLTFQNNPFTFELNGFKLEPVGGSYFAFRTLEESMAIENIRIEIPDKRHVVQAGKLEYDREANNVFVENFSYRPMIPVEKLAKLYKYNRDIYDFELQRLSIFNFDMDRLEDGKGLYLDSVSISGLDARIYKDKTKPFDISRRPELPHNALKKMKFPLLVEKLSIDDGHLLYEEQLPEQQGIMKVNMKQIRIEARNITSVRAHRKDPLLIDLKALLMNKAELNAHLTLPLQTGQDEFSFYGNLSRSAFKYYDDALIPALGLKVLKGDMHGLKFEARADSYSSRGTMTMLYDDLQAEVFKMKKNEKSGFLSWSVNNLVHKSNPGPNGEVRVAIMNFDRTLYKGMGNYLWKTIQSGLVNTIAPFGMTVAKENAKKERKRKREQRRKERKARS